jgi:hypothetical protein
MALVASGCFGPFNLTRRLYQWNAQVGEKWEREIVFLLLALTPVYSAAVLADAVVFNSMEFWTGRNPVDPPMMRKGQAIQTRRIALGKDEVRMTRTEDADYRLMTLEFFQDGKPAGLLRFERLPGQPTLARDANDRIIMSALATPRGEVVLTDGQGQRTGVYPANDFQLAVAAE